MYSIMRVAQNPEKWEELAACPANRPRLIGLAALNRRRNAAAQHEPTLPVGLLVNRSSLWAWRTS